MHPAATIPMVAAIAIDNPVGGSFGPAIDP